MKEEEYFEDEWSEHFGAPSLSDAEVEEILERARQTSDVKLRRLVQEFQLQRHLIPQLLELAKKSSEENAVLQFARFLINGTLKNVSF